MANHSPTPDNYVQNKTWDEVVEGKPGEPIDDFGDKTPEPEENAARKNGGGAKKPA
ncbi:hypothetical protein [Brevundimonas vesicularis]|uniref:Uncharacterized protein n=1 Tax=Brevundimonas vesicularis TaxID=41276 RepID=A0ABU4KNM0_BREVE|nr:hypothetical protein [Brevundimonas vesicularis]MDX2334603.1 hypothetical protein [Brevundimonas vesicularis]